MADINSKSIKDILPYSLEVPTYQRKYSWEEENVKDFITDIYDAMQENAKDEYFIGSMVMVKELGERKIIDGQQRMGTILLILLSITKYMKEEQKVAFKYANLIKEDRKPKLKLNTSDNAYWGDLFGFILEGYEISAPKRINIQKAYQTCEEEVGEIKRKGEIEPFLKFLMENVKIALVEVGDEVNAYFIFEVLNDRGLELSALELIKNYFYRIAEERGEETLSKVKELWSSTETYFKDKNHSRHDKNFQNFLYAYLVAKHPETKKPVKKKIFKRWKQQTAKENVQETLETINTYAKKYSFLITGQNEYNEYQKIKNLLATLQDLNWIAHVPVVISILEKDISEEEKKEMVKILFKHSISILFKNMSVGTLDTIYNTVCKSIKDNKIKTREELKNLLYEKLPISDEDVKSSILENRFGVGSSSSNKKTKFILSKSFDMDEIDAEKFTIEHILPKKGNNTPENGFDFGGENNIYTYKIGNILLLEHQLNKQGSSKSFREKKEIYSSSDSPVATIFFQEDYSEWNKQNVDERSNKIAERYLKFLNNI